METIKAADLPNDMSLFGGKGNVWSNTAHIYQSGNGNLCGTPSLSTNWVRKEGVTEAGCPECVEIYKNKSHE